MTPINRVTLVYEVESAIQIVELLNNSDTTGLIAIEVTNGIANGSDKDSKPITE